MAGQGLRVKRYIQLPIDTIREVEVDVIEIKEADLEIIKKYWPVNSLEAGNYIIQYDDETTRVVSAQILEKNYKPKAV